MVQTVQSVDRALKLLEVLSGYEDGLGLMEISQQASLTKSTAHRLLHTLIENNYVKQNGENGPYQLTFKMFRLGANTVEKMDILKLSRPYLQDLKNQFGEVIHLVIRDDTEIVYIDKVETDHTIRMYSNIGKRGTLYSTSVGKAILSYESDEDLKDIWKTLPIEKKTEYTITTWEEFLKEIKTIRKEGYALDQEENELGVRCIGVALLDYTGTPVGAISVSGPSQRMTKEKVEEIMMEILKIKAEISKELGYTEKK